MTRTAWGHALLTLTDGGTVLDAWFPSPALGAPGGAGELAAPAGWRPSSVRDEARGVTREVRLVTADLDAPPADAADGWLRLHLLSHRLVVPNSHQPRRHVRRAHQRRVDLAGPVRRRGLRADPGADAARAGTVQVFGVDKFPRMTDYVVPTGVRIADADRVRLGAHLASGTTVMHEGFVNFNAGTLGTSMVEGRISQGVVVGDGSDIGGGASTMGTLSGGGTERVSIGERCLLGAESGLGIALGDDCVVEAGLYVTAGTKVTLPDGTVAKARELSGQSNLLFLRNSVTGAVEARPRDGHGIVLNSALHAND